MVPQTQKGRPRYELLPYPLTKENTLLDDQKRKHKAAFLPETNH